MFGQLERDIEWAAHYDVIANGLFHPSLWLTSFLFHQICDV